jgi:hypothetical protein
MHMILLTMDRLWRPCHYCGACRTSWGNMSNSDAGVAGAVRTGIMVHICFLPKSTERVWLLHQTYSAQVSESGSFCLADSDEGNEFCLFLDRYQFFLRNSLRIDEFGLPSTGFPRLADNIVICHLCIFKPFSESLENSKYLEVD